MMPRMGAPAPCWRRLAGSSPLAAVGPAMAIDSFDYQPPERGPKGELSRFVPENPDIVLEQVWAFIEQQGFALESVDPQARLLVARYSGDPRPYVDCGLVTALDDGAACRPAAAVQRQQARGPHRQGAQGAARRPVARACSSTRGWWSGSSRAAPGRGCSRVSTYVAAKSINRLRKGGRPDELVDREVISFQSGEEGRFAKGTICVATGKLESLPLKPVPQDHLSRSAAPGRRAW